MIDYKQTRMTYRQRKQLRARKEMTYDYLGLLACIITGIGLGVLLGVGMTL